MTTEDHGMVSLRDPRWVIVRLLEIPALCVMIFVRKKIGARALATLRVVALGVLMIFIGVQSNGIWFRPRQTDGEGIAWLFAAPDFLIIQGFALIGAALSERWKRHREFKRGIRRHTYSRGDSYFDFLPLNQFTLYRFFDPLLAIGIGYLCFRFISHALGTVWIAGGICLHLIEQIGYFITYKQNMDLVDVTVDSEAVSDVVQHFEAPKHAEVSRAGTELSTGNSPELEALMARRKKRGNRPN